MAHGMFNSGTSGGGRPKASKALESSISPEHYLRVILHRKWLVLAVFLVVSAGTAIYSYRLQDVFTSDTLILVDPLPRTLDLICDADTRRRLERLGRLVVSEDRPMSDEDVDRLIPEAEIIIGQLNLIGFKATTRYMESAAHFGKIVVRMGS